MQTRFTEGGVVMKELSGRVKRETPGLAANDATCWAGGGLG